MAGVMTQLLRKSSTQKFSEQHIEDLGDSVQAKVARAFNSYPVTIGEDKIREFLQRRAEASCKEKGYVKRPDSPSFGNAKGKVICNLRVETIEAAAKRAEKKPEVEVEQNRPGIFNWTIGFSDMNEFWLTETWHETSFNKYPHVAPEFVARKFQQAKASGLFDKITVATLQEAITPITNDPLLLGRIKGSSVRFFICQWDSDIVLDDVL